MEPEPRRTAIQTTHRVLLVVLGVLLLALLVTGIWVSVQYQPTGNFVGSRSESPWRVAHRITSGVFIVAALVTLGLSIAISIERTLKRGLPAWFVGALTIAGALAASFTGYLLPWEVLALASVRPNGERRGFGFLFGHAEVRSVFVRGVVVAKGAFRGWFLLHTVAIPIGLVLLGVAGWRVTRRARVRPPTD